MRLALALGTALTLALVISYAPMRAQQDQIAALRAPDAPAHGVWIDSLDLSKVSVRRPPAGRGGNRAGQPGAAPATPPPPPVYSLGGSPFAHVVPTTSDTDFAIDLKGNATKLMSVVGINDVPPRTGDAAGRGGNAPAGPPQGTVVFGVWVDGKKAFDSGIMKTGDAPKLVSVDLTGARRLMLAVNDANDGSGGDNANWGGAVVILKSDSGQKPEVVDTPVEPQPTIASSKTSAPQFNSPTITGATPGRPFMFLLPVSGDEPMTYAAKNLPAGLTLDAHTGLITGSLTKAGRTVVDVTATNAKGKAAGQITIVGGDHMLALTPPLGWNSWNAWGNTVTAEKVSASADGMLKSGLARQGYTYINIDDVWEAGNEPPPGTTRGRNPAAARDANGEIMSNANFPDMKGLVDHIHSLGLKAGIYSSPGPTTCQGLAASFGHEQQDAKTWAKWGFDYLKYDWCSYQGDRNSMDDLQKPYKVMRTALDTVDRDFVFSLCQYGWGNVWEWGQSVGGNLWRMTGDIRDSWSSMAGIAFQQTGREKYAGPGHWNDTDMLVVGMVGWSQGTRPTNLTPNEQLTHIALWALQAAPMLIGADLSKIDDWTTNVLGNREVLAVNQDVLGKAAGRLSSDGWMDVWARPLSDGTMAVGLFNRSPEAGSISVKFSDLGISGTQPVRDLWQQKSLGTASNQFTATVPRHGVVFVKIGAPKKVL